MSGFQRPGATHIAGFHAWKQFGRNVRKGEKGIAILAPIVVKREVRDDQKAETATLRHLVGFKTAYVFDVNQTEGAELPEFATIKGDASEHIEPLKAFIRNRGISLTYDAAIAPAKGVSRGGSIVIAPGLPLAEEFATLVHEAAHELLHRGERRKETTKTIRETEAEAVAFVVCKAIGLDTNTAACDYIKLYNGDSATLAASLQFVQTTAAAILNSLQPAQEERAA